MTTILIVDDKHNIRELARLYLTNEGYQVLEAPDGLTALKMVEERRPDLLLLDIMLPHIDGWEVCRRLRQAGNTIPIIMLTARTDDVDKIVGLELGADDYVTKPFNPRELTARVKAVLRRFTTGLKAQQSLTLADLRVEKERHEAYVGEKLLDLRPKEFDLLIAFVENAGLVLSREQLLQTVWGYDYYGDTRTVDVHVAHLREKLAGSSLAIETIRGTGYKLVTLE